MGVFMKTVLLAGAALALAMTGSAYAAAGHNAAAAGARGNAQHTIHAPSAGLATLYDQNIGDAGYGFFSQTLSSYPQYDEYLADDFVVPAGHTWKIKEVDTTGFYYIGVGPAHSVNVLFWNNNGGLPKGTTPLVECDNIAPASGLDTGSFQIKLPKSCKVALSGGKKSKTYWVTVQANMDSISTSGYWAWMANSGVAGNVSAGDWYGGSVGTLDPSCNVSFQPLPKCTGSTLDFAFALQGKDAS
jgi:hypothetical protein